MASRFHQEVALVDLPGPGDKFLSNEYCLDQRLGRPEESRRLPFLPLHAQTARDRTVITESC